MALSEIDRELLGRCLAGEDTAWRTFADRFLGLVTHVVNHAADCRSVPLSAADREDCVAEVFLEILRDDMKVLRRFQGSSSLATYLAVIARRTATRRLMRHIGVTPLAEVAHQLPPFEKKDAADRVENEEEVERMLGGLQDKEAQVVRLFHLEGKSYQEISQVVGMPENSIGPLLTRVRGRLRKRAGVEEPTG